MLNLIDRYLVSKKIFISAILFFTAIMCNHSNGQDTSSSNFYNQIKNYDLSSVFNPDSIIDDGNIKYKHRDPLGYIDTNYQRFQIHFTSIVKSKFNPYEYKILGKTKVKDNICSFTGTITVIAADFDTSRLMKEIGFPTYKEGYITGHIQIYEDKNQSFSGFINGQLSTDCYIYNKGKINYNALMLVADGFFNNQFEGEWTSYKTGKTKKCNWGDCRIPDSKYLDGGTGEFYPEEKYIDNGWRNYYNCLTGSMDDKKTKEAERIENIEWWK